MKGESIQTIRRKPTEIYQVLQWVSTCLLATDCYDFLLNGGIKYVKTCNLTFFCLVRVNMFAYIRRHNSSKSKRRNAFTKSNSQNKHNMNA